MLFLRLFTTSLTVVSISLLICTAFSLLFKAVKPALIISLANKVDVVVPSPAFSAVFIAACFTNCTPNSWLGSFNVIDFATVTPSLVDCGAPISFAITTFRPLGPNVDTTASANISIPFTKLVLAFEPNITCLLIW